MSLPVINAPTYELVVPSTKEKIKYRPFLVKEEKILLLALEDGADKALATALKQIVNNCTFEKLPVDTLPLFDLEFMFLRIRAKSVGEEAELKLLCEDDGETWPWCRDIDQGMGFSGLANWHLNGQLAYPTLVEGRQDELHVAYSWAARAAIRYICLNLSSITGEVF